MRWPHRVVIERQVGGEDGGGGQDEDTGVPTPAPGGDTTTIHEGRADVQDAGVAIEQDTTGRVTRTADAVMFLQDESVIPSLKDGDQVSIYWQPAVDDADVSTGSIEKIVRLDGKVFLRYL